MLFSTRIITHAVVIALALTSCIASVSILLWGLIFEGPAFYNGSECRMTYSQFQFLPLRVMPPPLPPSSSSLIEEPKSSQRERYRLLKFTDARDPRHRHLYPISGTMIENNESQSNPRKKPHKNGSNSGRLLEITDNWCLLPRDMIDNNNQNSSTSTSTAKWREAPYPHRGHPILYVPGHWGSFSQSRSIGAHGTRWTEPYARAKLDQEMYESLQTGRGMNDGLDLPINGSNVFSADHDVTDWLTSSQFQNQRRKYLDGFVMDVFALDFDGEGAALHPSRLVRQADFFARSVQAIAKGCQLVSKQEKGLRLPGIQQLQLLIGLFCQCGS